MTVRPSTLSVCDLELPPVPADLSPLVAFKLAVARTLGPLSSGFLIDRPLVLEDLASATLVASAEPPG